MHVFEANRFHFFHAPLDSAARFRRARHARADVITEFFEILVCVRVHRAGAGNGRESFKSAVIRGNRDIVRAGG